jgi:hypothetical protein
MIFQALARALTVAWTAVLVGLPATVAWLLARWIHRERVRSVLA